MPNTSYDTDLTDAAWALVEPLLPAAKTGGRPRTTDTRAVLNGIFYLLRSGCQWRLLPHEFPPWGTVYYYFRSWDNAGVWVHLQRALYEQTRVAAGRETCPSVVIMDGQSVKTTERGGVRGFDGHKRIKGRKRHILVDTLGLPIASRVEPANMSDKRAGARLVAGLSPLFPRIHTVVSVGINRRGVVDERTIQERSSDHLDPEPCGASREGVPEALGRGICSVRDCIK